MGDWCENFFSRMRDNVANFENILNQLSNSDDVLGESGDGSSNGSSTLIIGGLIFMLVVFIFYRLDNQLPPSTHKAPRWPGGGDRDDDDANALD